MKNNVKLRKFIFCSIDSLLPKYIGLLQSEADICVRMGVRILAVAILETNSVIVAVRRHMIRFIPHKSMFFKW